MIKYQNLDIETDHHRFPCNDKDYFQIFYELSVTFVVLSAGITVQFVPLDLLNRWAWLHKLWSLVIPIRKSRVALDMNT